jgi:hypothetical protein
VDALNHLPPLPLFIDYLHDTRRGVALTKQDELGIYHALRLNDRVCHIDLTLPPHIFHQVLVLMDKHFPILEHLSLSFEYKNSTPLTLPKGFLAPNLRHLILPGFSPPKRLRFLTSTVSLVKLQLSNIDTSSYFRPKLFVARLLSLPHLETLSIGFSIPIPRPSTENELLGEQGASVTLPSLQTLRFTGVSAYLESLVAQIRVPRLKHLDITLFNQIAFALPHLCHLIDIAENLKLPTAIVDFGHDKVYVTTSYPSVQWFEVPFRLRVKCRQLDWQIDCAAQICHALIPALSSVEQCTLYCDYREIPTELQNGAIDSTTWHELLRPFTGVKELYIVTAFLEELSRALQVEEVGLDPGFLPNLRSISARRDVFTSFIDISRAVGRPVQFRFSEWDPR